MPMAASSDSYSAFETRIGQLVPRAGIGIGPDRTIREAAERMTEESIGSPVVLESGEPAGMVTKTDVVRRVIALNRLMERYEGSEARLGERVAEATASADAEMKQLGTVLDSLGQGVIVCDAAGNVVRYNRTARSLLEPSHEPRLGQPVYGMVEKSCATTPWRTSPPSLPPESGIRRWSSPRSVRPGTRSGVASHRWRTMMRRFTASS